MRFAARISDLFGDYNLGAAKTAKLAFEILLVRVVPGVINVGVLFVLAAWLSRESYGLASTFMATATAAATFLFGPILQTALVQHAEHSEGPEQRTFEHGHATNALLMALVVCLVGLPPSYMGLFDWRMVACTAVFGFYTAILQISRSRLQFYRFGIGSTAQSVAFLLFSFLLVRPDPSIQNVLEAFGASYLAGAVASGALVNLRFAKPDWRKIREILVLGAAPTLSNVSETVFSLGSRYILVAVGRVDALGTYSFSLDLAQKTVAIFINIATFGIVPHALKSNDVRHLWRSLARGSLVALLVSVASAGFILLLGLTTWISALNGLLYDPVSFIIVSLAVMINRTGKMMLTPVSMRVRRAHIQLIPMIVMSPIGLLIVWAGTAARVPYAIELGYLVTLTAWTVWGYQLLFPRVRELSSSTAYAGKDPVVP